MKWIIAIAAILALTACTSPDDVRKYAEAEGWESYEVTGYRFFGCSKDDVFHTGFVAVKNGKRISGVICSGWLKGATLRLD
ncbi:MAG: hypothetical protein K8U57_30545 [Planctomycetes bacterium]|nr:hypothetical protein [Planctomycetota bacterium]